MALDDPGAQAATGFRSRLPSQVCYLMSRKILQAAPGGSAATNPRGCDLLIHSGSQGQVKGTASGDSRGHLARSLTNTLITPDCLLSVSVPGLSVCGDQSSCREQGTTPPTCSSQTPWWALPKARSSSSSQDPHYSL